MKSNLINNAEVAVLFDSHIIDWRTVLIADRFFSNLGVVVPTDGKVTAYQLEMLFHCCPFLPGAGRKTITCVQNWIEYREEVGD